MSKTNPTLQAAYAAEDRQDRVDSMMRTVSKRSLMYMARRFERRMGLPPAAERLAREWGKRVLANYLITLRDSRRARRQRREMLVQANYYSMQAERYYTDTCLLKEDVEDLLYLETVVAEHGPEAYKRFSRCVADRFLPTDGPRWGRAKG